MRNRVHFLKTWPEPFQALLDGRKRFEFRKNDRGFAVEDTLVLYEFEPSMQPHSKDSFQTGNWTIFEVSYVLTGGFGIPDGYAIMSIYPKDYSGEVLPPDTEPFLKDRPRLRPEKFRKAHTRWSLEELFNIEELSDRRSFDDGVSECASVVSRAMVPTDLQRKMAENLLKARWLLRHEEEPGT